MTITEEVIDKIDNVSRYQIPQMFPSYNDIKLDNLNRIINVLLHTYKYFNNYDNYDDCLLRVAKYGIRNSIFSNFGCYSPVSTHKCVDCCFYNKNIKSLNRTLYQLKIQINLQLNKEKKDE